MLISIHLLTFLTKVTSSIRLLFHFTSTFHSRQICIHSDSLWFAADLIHSRCVLVIVNPYTRVLMGLTDYWQSSIFFTDNWQMNLTDNWQTLNLRFWLNWQLTNSFKFNWQLTCSGLQYNPPIQICRSYFIQYLKLLMKLKYGIFVWKNGSISCLQEKWESWRKFVYFRKLKLSGQSLHFQYSV